VQWPTSSLTLVDSHHALQVAVQCLDLARVHGLQRCFGQRLSVHLFVWLFLLFSLFKRMIPYWAARNEAQ
jgi:hypothetical protein